MFEFFPVCRVQSKPFRWMLYFVAIFFLLILDVNAKSKESICDILQRHGLEIGYNPSQDCFVFVGTAEHEVKETAIRNLDLMQRNVWCWEAELNARKSLIKGLKIHYDIAFQSKNKDKNQTLDSVKGSYWARTKIMGHTTIAQSEVFHDGFYQVTVALKWGANQEEKAVKTIQGKCNARKDLSVWKNQFEQMDISSLPGNYKFIDSDGVMRYAGIGCADIDSIPMDSLRMKHKMSFALAMARSNLSLTLSADIMSIDDMASNIERIETAGLTNQSFEVYMNSMVQRSSNSQTAFAPEVYAKIVVHPITKRKMFVSVCGYEPWQLSRMGFGKELLMDCKQGKRTIENDESVQNDKKVEIFNPLSGKFEPSR